MNPRIPIYKIHFSTLAALLVVVSVILTAGCGGRTVGGLENDSDAAVTTDGHTRIDSTVLRDGRVPLDGELPDGGRECEYSDSWELLATPLEEIVVLNPMWGGDGIPHGVTIRMDAVVTETGCDRLAGVQFSVHPQDEVVNLYAYLWRYTGDRPCPYESRRVHEYLALKNLPPGDWSAYDFMINGPPTPFFIRACAVGEDCMCNDWQGTPGDWGAECAYDCMCAGPLGCVYETEWVPSAGACFKTCSTAADCRLGLFCHTGQLTDTPYGICMATGVLPECSPGDCEPGFSCQESPQGGSFCVATMSPQTIGNSCGEDCDCPPGYRCGTTDDIGMKTCQIPCRGNRDCPEGLVCDSPGSINGLYCSQPTP